MMMHNHLLGGPSSLAGPSGLQSAAALSEGALLNHSLNQSREELKTHFTTREGTYRVMSQAEYSRPTRVPMTQMQSMPGMPNVSGAPVRVSFLTLPVASPCSCLCRDHPRHNNPDVSTADGGGEAAEHQQANSDDKEECGRCYADRMRRTMRSEFDGDDRECMDRICFNVGRELYVYVYRGPQSAADLNKPIDKRVYKGTFPTCHDFNSANATPTSCSLIIGFSAGQVQLIDPFNKEYQASRLFNEERFIDKSTVTCLKWVPGHAQHFLVSYSSGFMYLYNEELQCPQSVPSYQVFKQGEKFTVYTCKAKSTRNPIYRWQVGQGPINQFAFSCPDARMLATVSNDGYLRIFNYHQMELLSCMKSYFGGLLTLAWSPDAKLIVTGGEDDLLTVYHVQEKRVVCRGQGHKSWISQVAFDPYTCTTIDTDLELNGLLIDVGSDDDLRTGGMGACRSTAAADQLATSASERERDKDRTTSLVDGTMTTPVMRNQSRRQPMHMSSISRCSFASFGTINGTSHTGIGVCYRIGSVGHDTQLCLWDITEEMLKPSNIQRHRNSTIIAPMIGLEIQTSSRLDPLSEVSPAPSVGDKPKKKRGFHRRGFTLGRLSGGSSSDRRRLDSPASLAATAAIDEARLLGTKICPRMEDLPVIEPLVCKKIAHERLTTLEFRRDCIVTACQEGFICTWARPGKTPASLLRRDVNSPPNALISSSPLADHNREAAGGNASVGGVVRHQGYWSQQPTIHGHA